jgi:hypothetical protein
MPITLPHGIIGDAAVQMSSRILVDIVSIDFLHHSVDNCGGDPRKVTILSILVSFLTPNRWSVKNGKVPRLATQGLRAARLLFEFERFVVVSIISWCVTRCNTCCRGWSFVGIAISKGRLAAQDGLVGRFVPTNCKTIAVHTRFELAF